jgi:hypothetical protein
MTQIEWRTFQKGDATALAALFRDAVMPLTGARCDTAARLAWAGLHVPGEEVVARNGVSLTRLSMQKPLDAAPPRR